MNAVEAIRVIDRLSSDEDKLVRDACARLLGSVDVMLKFREAGRFTEAKYVAPYVEADACFLISTSKDLALTRALEYLASLASELLRTPNSAPSLSTVLSAAEDSIRRGPEKYHVGERVKIADLNELERFRAEWKYHNPLAADQLKFAGTISEVRKVDYYHGGDALYYLSETGSYIWHEECLLAADGSALA